MSEDFQRIYDDNISLKKMLQVTRHHNDKLQQELSEMREQNQELAQQNATINQSLNQLQRKYQLQMSEHNKDVTTLTAQIQQLKELIEQKQLELQNFQIRMIPNLDQDMIRVKLISEMEGPYQETVDKKDKQIMRLKEKLAESQRKSDLIELQLETKQKDLKRELAQTKQFYEKENEKIMRELSLVLGKKQVKSYDKQLFKSQRKELDELRYTIDMQSQNEIELRKQLTDLKLQKEKLLLQIGQINQKKALEMHLSTENTEIKGLRHEKRLLEEQIVRKNEELQKMEKRIRTMEKESRAMQDELRRANGRNEEKWQLQKKNIYADYSREKQQLRKNQHARERQEEEIQILNQKLRATERELSARKQECDKLKEQLAELERTIRQYQFSKKQKLSLSKDLRENSEQRPKKMAYLDSPSAQKQNHEKGTRPVPNRRPDRQTQNQANFSELQRSNAKLKQKLQKANKKIVQLLTEKAVSRNRNASPEMNYRDRTFSNIEIDPRSRKQDKPLLLQFRDTGFVPLVPPTIYVPQSKR